MKKWFNTIKILVFAGPNGSRGGVPSRFTAKVEEIKLSKNLELRNSIDLGVVWGEYFITARKRLWFKEDSLIITGHPKYDIYFKKNKNIHKKAKNFIITVLLLGNPFAAQTKDKEQRLCKK